MFQCEARLTVHRPNGWGRVQICVIRRTPTSREGLENLAMPRMFLVGEGLDYPEACLLGNGVILVIVLKAGQVISVDNLDGFDGASGQSSPTGLIRPGAS